MSHMKTALEIALEKLNSVEADPTVLERKKYEDIGKKLFGRARIQSEGELDKEIETHPKEKHVHIQNGFLTVYLQSIVLPQSEEQLESIDGLQHCAELFVDDPSSLRQPFSKLESISRQYLSVLQQIDSTLQERFAPMLKEREMQMSQKLGYAVKLDFAAIPEYTRQRNETTSQYREKFNNELIAFKQELQSLLTKYSV